MRNIKGYEDIYSIDEYGNVYSNYTNKFLKPFLNREDGRGRLFVILRKDGKNSVKYIHKLVAENFLGHISNGYKEVVDHIDNNPLNNHVSNLQLTTARHNLCKDKKNKTSKYAGVSWNKQKSKWVSQISVGHNKIYLGQFKCELSAAFAYNLKLKELSC
jgi:hypothetical protein